MLGNDGCTEVLVSPNRACKWLSSRCRNRTGLQIEFGKLAEGIKSAFACNKRMWMRLQSSVQRKVQKRRGGRGETRASQVRRRQRCDQSISDTRVVHTQYTPVSRGFSMATGKHNRNIVRLGGTCCCGTNDWRRLLLASDARPTVFGAVYADPSFHPPSSSQSRARTP